MENQIQKQVYERINEIQRVFEVEQKLDCGKNFFTVIVMSLSGGQMKSIEEFATILSIDPVRYMYGGNIAGAALELFIEVNDTVLEMEEGI